MLVRLLIISAILIFSSTNLYAQIKLVGTPSVDIIEPNGFFEWSLEIEGTSKNPKLEFSKFKKVQGPSTSQQVSIVNGKMTQSLTFTFILQAPSDEGIYQLPVATIDIDGRIYTNRVNEIHVKSSSSSKPSNSNQKQEKSDHTNQSAWIETSLDKKSVYIGERLRVQYKLYFENARNLSIKELPQGTGISIESAKEIKEYKILRETRNGRPISSTILYDVWITPTKQGTVHVKPIVVSIEMIRQVKNRRDPFSIFNDPFGMFDPFTNTIIQEEVSSKSFSIEVKPLPSNGKPQSGEIWVGDFEVTHSVRNNEIPVHQSSSIVVHVKGSGASGILPPKLIPVEGLEEYPVSVKTYGEGNQQRQEIVYPLIGRIVGRIPIVFQRTFVFSPRSGIFSQVLKDTLYLNVIGTSAADLKYIPQVPTMSDSTDRLPIPMISSNLNELYFLKIGWVASGLLLTLGLGFNGIVLFTRRKLQTQRFRSQSKKKELIHLLKSNESISTFDKIETVLGEYIGICFNNSKMLIHPDQVNEIVSKLSESESEFLEKLKVEWIKLRHLRYSSSLISDLEFKSWRDNFILIFNND